MKKIITMFLLVGLSLFAVSSKAALFDGQTLNGMCRTYAKVINNTATSDTAGGMALSLAFGCTAYVAGVFDSEMAAITKQHPNYLNCFNKKYPKFGIEPLALSVVVYFDNNEEAINKGGEYAVTKAIKQYYPANECLK